MALLTVNERKAIFEQLGFGEYNEKSIKAFQKKYMLRKSDYDGVYGPNTDNTLRTVFYTLKYTKNFKPEEFRCECNGKYCCGYPSYMKPAELIHIQAIRDHWKKPVTVTCGLRCKTWNSKLGGSIQNSLHMKGLAIDFYQQGVTDTLKNRKASIKWIAKQPNHHYTYGNGVYRLTINKTYSGSVSAPYMGNALHTDTNDNVRPVHPEWKEPEKPVEPPKPEPAPTPVAPKEPSPQDKMCLWAEKIASDDSYHYVKYSLGKKAHECPICHDHAKGTYHGGNCIWYAWASWRHGAGIKSRCSCDAMTDQLYEKVLNASSADALKIVRDRIKVKNIKVLKNKKGLALSRLEKGDIIVYFKGDDYVHTALYLGDGLIADCTSGRKDNIKYGVPSYTKWKIKEAIRYTGK